MRSSTLTIDASGAPPTPADGVVTITALSRRLVAWEAVAIGLLVTVIHVLLGPDEPYLVGSRGDDAAYVLLGKSIADGHGYRSLWYVGEPVQVKFPPALPSILALMWRIGGSLGAVHAGIHSLTLLVSGATAALLWWVGRTRLGLRVAPAFAFAIAPFLLDSVLQYFSLAVSEPYLMFAWALALALSYEVIDARHETRGVVLAGALGLTLAFGVLVRSQGVGLLPAFLLALIVSRTGWRPVGACAAGAFVPLALWHLAHARMIAHGTVSTAVADEQGYVAWTMLGDWRVFARAVLTTFFENLVMYLRVFATFVSRSVVLGVVVIAAATTFALSGGLRLVRRHPALVLSTLVTILLVLAFPWWDPRYLTVAVPFGGLIVAWRISREIDEQSRTGKRVAYGLLLALVLAMGIRQVDLRRMTVRAIRTGGFPSQFIPGYEIARTSQYLAEATEWLRQHARRDDRLLISWPTGIYLYTGLKTQNADPGEPSSGPSVFDVPGRYVAGRILEDSITMVVTSNPRSGTTADVATIRQRCPTVLTRQDGGAEGALPAYYRVTPDDACLSSLIAPR